MGDEGRFRRLYNKPAIGIIGRMSLNDLRQARYSYIGFITILNRAAIDGGVLPEEIFHLSDHYCQLMDSMDSIEEIAQLKLKTGLAYCRKVMQYKGYNNYTIVTRKCCEYIQKHLYEKILIRDLTAVAAINRHSLSIYFKQDTGTTISEYINIKRLEEANFLLKHTSQSISQISELLHYSSQSYFGKKYKEYFQITPQKYRDSVISSTGSVYPGTA
jgi:AraC-like DNA-binding protein